MALNVAGGAHIEIVDAWIESNQIKQVLSEKDLTQEELARCVGISYRHMNRLALGESDPSYLLVCRIGAVLQHPIDRLFQVKIRTRRRVPRGMTDAEFARRKAAVSERQRAAAHKAWTTRRARKAVRQVQRFQRHPGVPAG